MMPPDGDILGTELQKARERRDLTLDQAAQQTKIRPKFLEALEQGNYAALPGDVQTRGFLRIYARFLGLDEEAAMIHYDMARQASRSRRRKGQAQPLPPLSGESPAPPVMLAAPMQSASRQTQQAQQVQQPPSIRKTQTAQIARPPSYISPPRVQVAIPSQEELQQRERRSSFFTSIAIGTAGLLIVGGLLFLGWFGLQGLIAQSTPKPGNLILSPIPVGSGVGLGTPARTPADRLDNSATPLRPTPLPIPQTLAPTPLGNPQGGVNISLQIIQRTWLKVMVDGQQLYLGTIAPNTLLQYKGNSIEVRVANAAGVRAVVNGQDLGLLGSRGQIFDKIFTPGGEVIPPAAVPPVQPTPAANTQGSLSPPTSKALVSTSPTRLVPTATASVLPTLPHTSTASNTPKPSVTPSITATFSVTPSPSATRTATFTATASLTYTPSITYTPSLTLTPSNTPYILPRETSTTDAGQVRPK